MPVDNIVLLNANVLSPVVRVIAHVTSELRSGNMEKRKGLLNDGNIRLVTMVPGVTFDAVSNIDLT